MEPDRDTFFMPAGLSQVMISLSFCPHNCLLGNRLGLTKPIMVQIYFYTHRTRKMFSHCFCLCPEMPVTAFWENLRKFCQFAIFTVLFQSNPLFSDPCTFVKRMSIVVKFVKSVIPPVNFLSAFLDPEQPKQRIKHFFRFSLNK